MADELVALKGGFQFGLAEEANDAVMASHRAAMMAVPAPMIVLTTTGETVLVNDAFTRITGYTIADLPDIQACMETMRRVPAADVGGILRGWLHANAAHPPEAKEITVWTDWNEMRIWDIRTGPQIQWPDGRRVIIQTIFDVTEQRRLEEVLRRNQEEMRVRLAELESLYSSAPLGLAMLSRDEKIVRVNDALAEINGVSVREHIGRNAFEIIPELRDQLEPVFWRVLETGEAVRNIEIRGQTARVPGVTRDWLEHIYPLRDGLGEIVGVGVIVEEITERKKVESELAEANTALRRTLDLLFLALRTAGVSVFTQDRDLREIWVGGDFFGRSTLEPDDADSHLPHDLKAPLEVLKQRVLADGNPAHADLSYQVQGETRWCNVHIEPWRVENGKVESLLGAVSDITERKSTEQHVRTLLSELAHRSKNLLTVIQVMARRSVGPNLSSTDFVDSFIERLSGLAQSHDLLAREDWRGISMHELLSSQVGHLNNQVSVRLDISGPELVLTPVAAQNLGMAVHELSTNAVKYGALSVASGVVQIRWSLFFDEEGRDRLRLSWTERGGPPVAPPSRRGFGRFVIEAIAARALSGSVDLRFEPDGVSCFIEGAADATVLVYPPQNMTADA